jgi:hypothetical protein
VAFVLALFLAVFLLLRCTMSRGNKEILRSGSYQPSPSPAESSAWGQPSSTPSAAPVPPPQRLSDQVMAMSKQSVFLGQQEGGDEDHDDEVKPFEDNSPRPRPRPHHPHVVLPANQEETKPSSHEAMHLAPAMVTPLGTSPPTVAPSAADAGAVSMDLVADAKKDESQTLAVMWKWALAKRKPT